MSAVRTRTYCIGGLIQVAAGATGYIPPVDYWIDEEQDEQLIALNCFLRAGSLTFHLNHLSWETGILVTTTVASGITVTTTPSQTFLTTPTFMYNHDALAPVVDSISGTPDGWTIGFKSRLVLP